MELKTLSLDLGTIRPQESVQPGLPAGWYWDSNRGQVVYYDPSYQQFYTLQNGLLVPLGGGITTQTAGKTLALRPGDTVRVQISYKYAGPSVSGAREHFAVCYHNLIGVIVQGVSVDHTRDLAVANPSTPGSYSWTQDIVLPAGFDSGWNMLQCSVMGGTPSIDETGVRLDNAFSALSQTPTITSFTIVDFNKV